MIQLAQVLCAILIPAGVVVLPFTPNVAPRLQGDPVTLCARGVELIASGETAAALPLLEAGYAGREDAKFPSADEKGYCALALGMLRAKMPDPEGALEAYAVALGIFRVSGNRVLEGIALNNRLYRD